MVHLITAFGENEFLFLFGNWLSHIQCFPRQNSIVSLFTYQRGRIRKYIKARFPVGYWTTVLSPWPCLGGGSFVCQDCFSCREGGWVHCKHCLCMNLSFQSHSGCLVMFWGWSSSFWQHVMQIHCFISDTGLALLFIKEPCLLLRRVRYKQQSYIPARAQITSHKTCFCVLIFCSTWSLTFSSQFFLPL